MVRVAALEVPGVLKVSRGGPLARLAGSPVRASVGDGRVSVRVWIVARPGHPLGPLAAQVRQVVGATVVRLLGLTVSLATDLAAFFLIYRGLPPRTTSTRSLLRGSMMAAVGLAARSPRSRHST